MYLADRAGGGDKIFVMETGLAAQAVQGSKTSRRISPPEKRETNPESWTWSGDAEKEPGQVEFVEHPEKEPLAWRVQVEAQQRENPQNPAKKHTESWG